jgi:hypothetical protein
LALSTQLASHSLPPTEKTRESKVEYSLQLRAHTHQGRCLLEPESPAL